jgi:DNA-binding beta-propeller fold protein YncE
MRRVSWLGMGLTALTAACAGGTVAPASPKVQQAPTADARLTVLPVGESHVGSAVALARIDDRRVAFVADEDDGDIHTIDADTHLEISTSDVGGTPAQVLVLPDGRVAVSLRDRAAVAVFTVASKETGALRLVRTVPVPTEPVGLALTPDDATLLVTSGWAHALSALRAGDLGALYRVNLPREPRAVVVSDDGQRAFVSHVVGARMSLVVLAGNDHPVRDVELKAKAKVPDPTQKTAQKKQHPSAESESDPPFAAFPQEKEHDRSACQGFALAKSAGPGSRVLAPEVLVDPGDGTEQAVGYGSFMHPTEVGNVAVSGSAVARRFFSKRQAPSNDCLLPRATAYDAKSGSLLVACLGIDSVVEYDATTPDPHGTEKRRWKVASGPTGLAFDPDQRKVIVWSQFDRTVDFLPFDEPEPTPVDQDPPKAPPHFVLAVSRKAAATTADVAEGRKLFHAAGDARISTDGRACASCHPDGRDDSLTWATPDGPRNTPMLAGRVEGTAPYGWLGSGDDVHKHLTETFQRLGGRGFDDREMESLMAFVATMRTPVDAAVAPLPSTQAGPSEVLAVRGREIFDSQEAGCAGCHTPGHKFTDATRHDVGSGDPPHHGLANPFVGANERDSRGGFDTPSLRFVGGTAPYFHDGRYATLRDVLLGTDGKMGHVGQLSPRDFDALEAYLRTL